MRISWNQIRTPLGAALIATAVILTSATAPAQDLAEPTSKLLVEVTSPVNDWVRAPAPSRFCLNDSPGTLMSWSYGNATGGPDLNEPLVTDRPDFTEASSTVGQGVAQLEFGYTFTENRDNGDSERSHSIGEPLLRYGILANWLEFRVAVFPVQTVSTTGGVRTSTGGVEDLYLGFKIGLTPQEGFLPEMAIVPQMTVPSGSNAFTNDEVLAGVNWLYSWGVSDDFAIGGSTQFNRSLDDTGEGYIEFAQSLTGVLTLTDELGFYTEWYAFFPSGADTARVEHYLNGGFTYLVSNDVQWDIRVGTGLSDASDDYFVGTGLSIRFY